LEGTDERHQRAARIAAGKSCCQKSQQTEQDMRFDVPVVGFHDQMKTAERQPLLSMAHAAF